jgi:hypothetical protein
MSGKFDPRALERYLRSQGFKPKGGILRRRMLQKEFLKKERKRHGKPR